MIRVVLDTSVLVSALLSPAGAPADILRGWADGRFDVIVCPAQLFELERALAYPKLSSYITAEEAAEYASSIERRAVVAEDPVNAGQVTRDPNDAYIVALARDAGVHVIVSGDKDLLDLELEDIRTLSPRAFLDRLGGD